jgi:hypothetical protein
MPIAIRILRLRMYGFPTGVAFAYPHGLRSFGPIGTRKAPLTLTLGLLSPLCSSSAYHYGATSQSPPTSEGKKTSNTARKYNSRDNGTSVDLDSHMPKSGTGWDVDPQLSSFIIFVPTPEEANVPSQADAPIWYSKRSLLPSICSNTMRLAIRRRSVTSLQPL